MIGNNNDINPKKMNALIKIKAHIIEICAKNIFNKPVDKLLANGSVGDKKEKT